MAQPWPQLSTQHAYAYALQAAAAAAPADAHAPQADSSSISTVDGDDVQGEAPGYVCIQHVPPVDGHA